MGFIKALASNTSSLDGLDVHCGIIDELSAIKNRDIYDLIKQAMSARLQPLLFCITTNGFLRNGIFDAQYEYSKAIIDGDIHNKRFLPLIYELDAIEEWMKPETWIKANPALGTVKSYEKLKENVEKAKDDASFLPTVLVKDFNMKQTNSAAWLKFEELDNLETWNIQDFKYCVGGFDAADSIDLNAAKAVCMRPDDDKIYVKSMYWLPEAVIEQVKATRRERDNAPYELWVNQGWLRTCEGNKCDKRIFLEWFKELREDGLYTLFIGYDPWHISDDLLREFKMEFGKNSMIPVRQGFKTESEPLKEIKAEFQAHRIIYDNNPIDKWCLANSCVKSDPNGNVMLIKNPDRRNRNDGTSALLDAFVVLQNYKDKFVNLN
jgi:phage terminase large subunit-like protein